MAVLASLIRLAAAMLSLTGIAAHAQPVVSPMPERVSVTVYRAPQREADAAIDRRDPEGFALITETRRVLLPAGRTTIRFEGVAGNIFPETAIVSGLPQDVREKNLDADLLSPRSLYDRALGRRVIIRRTDRGTGKVVEQQAIIRSGANGAAILQIGQGFTDLRCSGLPETIVYDGIPAGLSARPTLSIETDSARAQEAVLTLSYLAGGFDWQADYVVQMRQDGRGADLFAWITLASSDVTMFEQAAVQVVAGKPRRDTSVAFGNRENGQLDLKCWDLPRYAQTGGAPPPPPPPPPPAPPPPAAPVAMLAEDIVVTGARIARQEDLGDLKLYRIADPVTVASKAQKQVALLSKDAVPVQPVYVSDLFESNGAEPELTLRTKNRVVDGLGLPLPAGQVAVFEQAGARRILIGESATDDKAIGEDVEFKLDGTPGVTAHADLVKRNGRKRRFALAVTNANPWSIAYEATIGSASGARVKGVGIRLGTRDGKPFWATRIAANGSALLEYDITDPQGR